MRKGHMTLALNGIAAPQEMHRLKKKALRRAKLEEGTSVIFIAEALRFIVLDEQERRANKALMLSYEADGLEIIEEIEGENGSEEFIIVKGEDSERDLKLS
uniref:Uncharacterized protein n=1 Tax=Fusarium oxysporum (strain Fo5176) TaxID=660025 RepID=A0A0D2YDP5_FUSOF